MAQSYLPTILLLAGIAAVTSAPAAKADEPQIESVSMTRVYKMPHKTTPLRLNPYNATLYSAGNFQVETFRGDNLHNTGKDTIQSFAVNPAGHNFIVVSKNKKGVRKAEIYSTASEENVMAKFNAKKYGMPVSATFSPDARTLYVATDRALYICDPRTMIPTGGLGKSDMIPTMMTVSPNGYFLAAVNGDKCRIYNLETNKIRKDIDAGAEITDINFSPDNSDLGILTDDGVLTLYGTRQFDMNKMIDDLGQSLAFAYNFDGKYVGVVTSPEQIEVVNLLNSSDREPFTIENGNVNDITFITDSSFNTLMANTTRNSVEARRLLNLKPYYNKLINDETDARMADWLKMMPNETLDEYRARVNDETRASQRRMFEYEISTQLAGNLISGHPVSLGAYDRTNGVLAIAIESMPTIFLPVPENEVTEFRSGADVNIDDVLFGVNPDDSFEIVYAKVTNTNNGKSYIFDNLNRASMEYMKEDDAISLETLQQQQMEEIRLQELRQQVMEEAKSTNVISDHTNITVDSRIVPEYDADGNRILNYLVSFTYDVSPGFSAQEDFGPGKYHVDESGAASSMLKIVKQAFEGDMAQYLGKSKKLRVTLTGTADATPIVHGLPYDGSYGDFDNEPVYINGQLSSISVDSKNLVKENQQLAFLRAMGVKDYLEKNVQKYNDISKDYKYEVNVSEGKGSEFRRITAAFTFVDAF